MAYCILLYSTPCTNPNADTFCQIYTLTEKCIEFDASTKMNVGINDTKKKADKSIFKYGKITLLI